jgi:antitoxin HicB
MASRGRFCGEGIPKPHALGRASVVPEIPFHVVVEFDPEDGGYIATTPALAGVAGQGETKQEAVEDLREALDFTVHDMLESGDPLPEDDEFAHTHMTPDENKWTIRVAV